MTYLAFLIATGLYLAIGSGGPLHNDQWYQSLQRRVDALEPDFWLGFVLMVVVPCAAFTLVYAIFEEMFGAAAVLLLGTPALFFSFGRLHWPALFDRFRSRLTAGDIEGALLTLEAAGHHVPNIDDAVSAEREGSQFLLYMGFQRWFSPVFYFLLFGPFFAVGYRLVVLGVGDRKVPLATLLHILDWLPSRVLLLTFGAIGNFESIRPLFWNKALDADVRTADLLMQGFELACPGGEAAPGQQVEHVRELLKRALAVWVVVASVLVIVS
jgi:AmpE protein